MTGAQIEQAGRLLFGPLWRAQFEAQFGVNNRTLRRILKDQETAAPGLCRDVINALRVRVAEISLVLFPEGAK